MESGNKKRHADFQDAYRRSSNFMNYIKKEKFELSEKGKVRYKVKKDD